MTLNYGMVSRLIASGGYRLYYLSINLVCGFLLGWRSGAYHLVTLTLTFTSDIVSSYLYLEHVSFITNNYPQMRLMVDQFLS